MLKLKKNIKGLGMFLGGTFFGKLFEDNLPSLVIRRSHFDRVCNFFSTYASEAGWALVYVGSACGLVVLLRFIMRYWIFGLIGLVVLMARMMLLGNPTEKEKQIAFVLLVLAATVIVLWKILEQMEKGRKQIQLGQ